MWVRMTISSVERQRWWRGWYKGISTSLPVSSTGAWDNWSARPAAKETFSDTRRLVVIYMDARYMPWRQQQKQTWRPGDLWTTPRIVIMSATQHQRLLWYFSCPNNRSNACCNTSFKTSSKRGREDGWGSARYRFLFLPLAWIHCLWSIMGHMTRGWQDKLKPCMWFSDSPVMFAVCYCQCRARRADPHLGRDQPRTWMWPILFHSSRRRAAPRRPTHM